MNRIRILVGLCSLAETVVNERKAEGAPSRDSDGYQLELWNLEKERKLESLKRKVAPPALLPLLMSFNRMLCLK